ncbi:MAG: hypothetical protein NTY94_05465 [Alphaproteobacteria bacterium]|jgi:hypothetical protein|nr:hypothetical protein [Alphaproteobacteria bacterium]
MSQPLSRDEFATLVKRAGLDLTQANIDDLYSAWPHIERFTALLRNPARGREAEPAHLFRPLNAEGV